MYEKPIIEAHKEKEPETIDYLITKYSTQYGVDESLVRRIVQCESGFNPNARNYNAVVGVDVGTMQINSHFHEERMESLGLDIYNTENNIEYGIRLISERIEHYAWSRHCWDKK